MSFDLTLHQRRSIRLQGYDYRQSGVYFVTVCTHERQCLLGQIIEGEMELNTLGCIVEEAWLKTPILRQGVELDEFIIMPNHFHAIVVLPDPTEDTLPSVGAHSCAPLRRRPNR